MIAFYKLPQGITEINYISIAQLGIIVWAIYILDRLLDNLKNEENLSKRHMFHQKNQFVFQLLFISLICIAAILLFFQSKDVILSGLVVLITVLIYLWGINKTKNGKFFKELIMPMIFCFAVIGIPFVEKTSINLSSWIVSFMFLIISIQNVLLFSVFEFLNDNTSDSICSIVSIRKIGKWLNYFTALMVFIVVMFFSTEFNFTSKLAIIFLIISVIISLINLKPALFLKNDRYRWLIDGLFFLPIFIF